MNISFIFNIFRDFSSGSVWELYLLSVMILIALFCNLMSLCVLKPHSKMLLLKCGAISELYMILRVYFGRKCFSLFITPNVRDILFAILSIYRSQFSVSWIVIPRKTNCRTTNKGQSYPYLIIQTLGKQQCAVLGVKDSRVDIVVSLS